MAIHIKCDRVIFDGEYHLSDDICWCDAEHDEDTMTNFHNVSFDEGMNCSS